MRDEPGRQDLATHWRRVRVYKLRPTSADAEAVSGLGRNAVTPAHVIYLTARYWGGLSGAGGEFAIVGDDLEAAGGMELAEDRPHVRFDCLQGDEERCRDRGVG